MNWADFIVTRPLRLVGRCCTVAGACVISACAPQVFVTKNRERLIAPTDPAIQYFGRWDQTNAKRPRASWPGFGFRTRFTGTSLRVRLRDAGNYYQVEIDDKPHFIVGGKRSGEITYELATGMSPGVHQVTMRRRNISFDAPTEFAGFVVDADAALLPLDTKPSRTIEFIGDSFTAAEGNEATDETLPWRKKYPVTNFQKGFAAQIAEELDAEITAVCRSGAGVVCTYTGDRRHPMGERYEWTLMDSPLPKWDSSSITPDLIIICLGLNDYGGLKSEDGSVSTANSREFRKGYHTLIRRVQSHHPHAQVVALSPYIPWLLDMISQVVREQKSAGNRRIHFAKFDRFENGYVADGHPTVETHRRMADQVISQLREMKLTSSFYAGSR